MYKGAITYKADLKRGCRIKESNPIIIEIASIGQVKSIPRYPNLEEEYKIDNKSGIPIDLSIEIDIKQASSGIM